MRILNKKLFYTGITILAILIISYFLKFKVDEGANYEVIDTLLGTIIFHNPIIFMIYLIIALTFIISGIKKLRLV